MSPRPPKISRDDVLRAALRIVDDDGLDGLTMRSLGAALSVDPMAVYRLFPSKSAVAAALADQFWASWSLPPLEDSADWRAYAVTLMSDVRVRLSGHPHLIPVIATHPLTSPAALSVADEAVGRLIDAGAPVHPELGHLVNTLVMLTVASALGEHTPPAGGGEDAADLQEATDLTELPHLGLLVQRGWAPSFEEQFAGAVRAVVTGWQFPHQSPPS